MTYCHAGDNEKYLPPSKIQSSSQKKGKGIFQSKPQIIGNGAMQVINKDKTQFSVGIKSFFLKKTGYKELEASKVELKGVKKKRLV